MTGMGEDLAEGKIMQLYDNFKILEKEVKKKVCFQSVKSQDMNLRQQEHNISELAVGPWAMKHTT